MSEKRVTGKIPRKKKIIVCPAGICIICNKEYTDLRDFQNNRYRNGKVENYMQALYVCFNIHLFNSQTIIRNSKICRFCIHQLRDALSFRRLVRTAQERLQATIDVLLNNPQTFKEEYPNENHKIKSERNVNMQPSYSCDSESMVATIKFNDSIKEEFKNVNYSEDNDNNDTYFDNYSSEEESSTTSEQMRIATGYKEIKEEVSTELPVPTLDLSSTTCPVCNKTFGKFKWLERHYESHSFNRKYLCHICGQPYALKRSYFKHMLKHSSRTFPCKICQVVCTDSGALSTHIRTHHCRKYIYSCTECDEKFRSSIVRRKHIYYKHPHIEVNPFPCSTCGKLFFGDAILRSHVRLVHDKVKEFCCTVCGRVFSRKKYLQAHMTIHTGIKDFKCTQCGNAFARKKTLTEHLKIHANIRNYKCDLCEKSFIQKCSLKTHMNTHSKNYF